MSLSFLNTAPGYDEKLRNSVFFERGLHATSICGASAPRWPWRCCRGRTRRGSPPPLASRPACAPARWRPTAPAGPSSGSTAAWPRTAAWQRPTRPGTGSPARRPCWRAASGPASSTSRSSVILAAALGQIGYASPESCGDATASTSRDALPIGPLVPRAEVPRGVRARVTDFGLTRRVGRNGPLAYGDMDK
jgi:hypothetical protein